MMTREIEGKTEPNEYMAGKWQIQAKTKDEFGISDGLGNPLPASIKISGGDRIRFAYTENPMEGKEGFYLYLDAVQLVEKRAREAVKFGAVKGGFDASTYQAAQDDADDEAMTEAPADGDY